MTVIKLLFFKSQYCSGVKHMARGAYLAREKVLSGPEDDLTNVKKR